MSAAAQNVNQPVPLCVDMDGTLLRTDTLFESVAWLLRHRWWRVLWLPFWWLSGRVTLKHRLTQEVQLNVALLPVHEEVLEFLQREKSAGRSLYLVTGADGHLARQVAARFGFFQDVMASDGTVNLTGPRKATALEQRFGRGGFDYIGNDRKDLAVWAVSRRALAAGAEGPWVKRLRAEGRLEHFFPDTAAGCCGGVKALRPHQWLKNLLLLVPLFTSHRWHEPAMVMQTLLGMGIMCCLASSAYLLNDMLDLEPDRQHAEKKRRPLAAGTAPLSHALVLVPVLFAGGLALSLLLGWDFVSLAAIYYVITVLYSVWLKRSPLLDVFTLAGLYTLRILLGGAATDIPISSWLLAFAVFYFLSLAFAKRVAELARLAPDREFIPGRGYQAADREHLMQGGVAGGYVAVLVFALYINSPEVRILYTRPNVLWLCCPLLLFWHSRLWLLAGRGNLNSDPVLFALKDRTSYFVGLLLMLVVLLAR